MATRTNEGVMNKQTRGSMLIVQSFKNVSSYSGKWVGRSEERQDLHFLNQLLKLRDRGLQVEQGTILQHALGVHTGCPGKNCYKGSFGVLQSGFYIMKWSASRPNPAA
jgi:hypothetical protein